MKLKEHVNRKQVVSCLVVLVLALALGIGVYTYENRFKAKEEVITLEYGENLSKDCSKYVDAREIVLEKTVLDTSGLDNKKVGTYQVAATYKDKKVIFNVKVEDTVAPSVTLKSGPYKVVAGQKLKATDIVADATDRAGIEMVSFDKGQVTVETDSKEPLDKIALKFDAEGEQVIKLSVADVNGNVSTEDIKVKVIEDYLAHVQGFKDLSITQGDAPDWMSGITKDERILEVTADAARVDVSKPGEYTLKYVVKGDDKETVVEKTVKVTVSAPKPVYTASRNSYSGGSGGGSYSGGGSSRGSSGSGSSGGGSSSGGSSSGHKPGDTFEGTQEGDKNYFDGEGGNWSEGGSFDW